MTLAAGDEKIIGMADDRFEVIDADGTEVLDALPSEDKERVVETYNEDCERWGAEPIDTVSEMPEPYAGDTDFWIGEVVEASAPLVFLRVLDAREAVYSHKRVGDTEVVTNYGAPPVDPDCQVL